MVFRKKAPAKGKVPVKVEKASPPSIISANLRISGDLDGDGDLQIEGRVDGNIRCETLTVGETGNVEGKVVANSLRLLGTIKGSVRARVISMMKSAKMIGDVTHERIEIQAGAMVDGLFKHAKAEDFEKRGARFKDAAPPDRPKGPVSKKEKPAIAASLAPAQSSDKPDTKPLH